MGNICDKNKDDPTTILLKGLSEIQKIRKEKKEILKKKKRVIKYTNGVF